MSLFNKIPIERRFLHGLLDMMKAYAIMVILIRPIGGALFGVSQQLSTVALCVTL